MTLDLKFARVAHAAPMRGNGVGIGIPAFDPLRPCVVMALRLEFARLHNDAPLRVNDVGFGIREFKLRSLSRVQKNRRFKSRRK